MDIDAISKLTQNFDRVHCGQIALWHLDLLNDSISNHIERLIHFDDTFASIVEDVKKCVDLLLKTPLCKWEPLSSLDTETQSTLSKWIEESIKWWLEPPGDLADVFSNYSKAASSAQALADLALTLAAIEESSNGFQHLMYPVTQCRALGNEAHFLLMAEPLISATLHEIRFLETGELSFFIKLFGPISFATKKSLAFGIKFDHVESQIGTLPITSNVMEFLTKDMPLSDLLEGNVSGLIDHFHVRLCDTRDFSKRTKVLIKRVHQYEFADFALQTNVHISRGNMEFRFKELDCIKKKEKFKVLIPYGPNRFQLLGEITSNGSTDEQVIRFDLPFCELVGNYKGPLVLEL